MKAPKNFKILLFINGVINKKGFSNTAEHAVQIGQEWNRRGKKNINNYSYDIKPL